MRLFIAMVLFFPLSIAFATPKKSPAKLLAELESANLDSIKINLLHQLGKYYQREHYDSARYFLNQGLAIANRTGITLQRARLLLTKARVMSSG